MPQQPDTDLIDEPVFISCRTCGTEFQVMEGFEKYRQAHRCSATVTEQGITGHYGSTTIDMEFWAFTDGRPSHVGEGEICDDCITTLKESGAIRFKTGGIL